MAFDEGLGFAKEYVGDQPVKPTIAEVATVELRQPPLDKLNSFGEGGAGLLHLLGSVMAHHLGLRRDSFRH